MMLSPPPINSPRVGQAPSRHHTKPADTIISCSRTYLSGRSQPQLPRGPTQFFQEIIFSPERIPCTSTHIQIVVASALANIAQSCNQSGVSRLRLVLARVSVTNPAESFDENPPSLPGQWIIVVGGLIEKIIHCGGADIPVRQNIVGGRCAPV